MTKLLLTTTALVAITISGSAIAADMSVPAPVYKAPPPAPVYSWTGCYLGGGGGYGMWNQKSYVNVAGAAITSSETDGGSGWFGQGQVGCDYQFTAPIFNANAVIGVFSDFEGGSITGTSAFPGVVGDEKESRAWAVGGRVGLVVAPRVLTFFDGGYTQARFDQVNYNFAIPGGGASGFSLSAQTYNGYFLGSGFEYSLDWLAIPGLFIKTEYRYSKFQTASVPITGVGLVGATLQSQKTTQMVSTELVLRFNGH